MSVARLLKQAEALLRSNDRGGYTVPAPALYPHQWNWDSAFCAIGWSRIDPLRAAEELLLLLRGQWDNGMIPHIVFNPGAEHYEPGPKAWRTTDVKGAPPSVRTSSITQPPVAATAARKVLVRAGGNREVEAKLKVVAEGLERWHRWFSTERDPKQEGLPCIVHPWESGLDNAPRWDIAMKRIEPGQLTYQRKDDSIVNPSQRPTRYDYDRYFFLVEHRAKTGFAPPKPGGEPFLIQDVVLAAILCRAEEDLAHLAAELGVKSAARERHLRLSQAIADKLFDPETGRFHDYDLVADRPIRAEHLSSHLPIFAGLPLESSIEAATRALTNPSRYGSPWPAPTVSVSDRHFEPSRYWRGPTWINTNWLLIDGLERAGRQKLARELSDKTIDLIARAGFREYFNPITGEGLGAEAFAWTAALAIDLITR